MLVFVIYFLSYVFYFAGLTIGILSLFKSLSEEKPREYLCSIEPLLKIVVTGGILLHVWLIQFSEFDFINSLNISVVILIIFWQVMSFDVPIPHFSIVLLPIAIIVLTLTFLVSQTETHPYFPIHTIVHIVFSFCALGFSLLITCIAVMLSRLDKALRNGKINKMIQTVPSIDLLKQKFSQYLLVTFIFLSLSIAVGILEIGNIIEQRVSHKIFFSIISWVLITIVLFKNRLGKINMSNISVLCIISSLNLIVGFLGSKIVFEYILS